MAAGRYTSRIFQAGRLLHARLHAAQFPAHPVTNAKPSVEFSEERPGECAEAVVLSLTPDESSIEWRRLGPGGSDELIAFDVTIYAETPNVKTSAAVWDRLEQLADVVQEVLFDTTTERVVPLGFDGELDVGRAVGVRPAVVPTGDGWIGRTVITIALRAAI